MDYLPGLQPGTDEFAAQAAPPRGSTGIQSGRKGCCHHSWSTKASLWHSSGIAVSRFCEDVGSERIYLGSAMAGIFKRLFFEYPHPVMQTRQILRARNLAAALTTIQIRSISTVRTARCPVGLTSPNSSG